MSESPYQVQPCVGEVMTILMDIFGVLLFSLLLLIIYVTLHMQEEERLEERFPLMWEEGGFLRTFWNNHITKKSKK